MADSEAGLGWLNYAGDWLDDSDKPLNPEEVRTEDTRTRVVYRVHTEEYTTGSERVADLITAIRLAYEASLFLLSNPP